MSQTYALAPWSLSDLFPSLDSAETKSAFERLEAEAAQFEARRQQLTADITRAAFMQIVHEYEKLNNQAYRIYGFANLLFTSDTQDQASIAFLGQVEQFMATLQNRTLFLQLVVEGSR